MIEFKTKRFAPKLHIKVGDLVQVIAGSSKGKQGKVLSVDSKKNRAVVEGVAIVKKHTRATENNPGGINEIESSINISNLMIVDPKSGKPTRVGRKQVDGKNVRYSKKSGEIIK